MTRPAAGYELRAATLDDITALARVHIDAWRETYAHLLPPGFLASLSAATRAQMWLSVLTGGEGPSFVRLAVVDGATLAGFGLFAPRSEVPAGYDGEIRALYLLKKHHGRGIGRALLREGAAWCAEQGHRGLAAWALAGNDSGTGFYRRMGAREIATRDIDIAGTAVPEIAFGWDAAAMPA